MADAEQKVLDIISDVRSRGFAALAELARKFDGVEQSHPRVPAEALTQALAELDPEVRAALEESISRARQFADQQRPANVDVRLGRRRRRQPELDSGGPRWALCSRRARSFGVLRDHERGARGCGRR